MIPDFNAILATFTALVGFPVLVAAIVNGLKDLGIVKDGDAPKFVAGFNALGLIVLLVVQVALPAFDVKVFDEQLVGLSAFIVMFVSFMVQMGVSKLAHISFKGIPFIGTSFSQDK